METTQTQTHKDAGKLIAIATLVRKTDGRVVTWELYESKSKRGWGVKRYRAYGEYATSLDWHAHLKHLRACEPYDPENWVNSGWIEIG